jgi:rod shape-determining protein MreB and related proteins
MWQQMVAPDVAVDLGTANTRVAIARKQMSFETASVAGTVSALRAGVVVDGAAAAEILRPTIARLRGLGLRQPRVLACAPSDTTGAEREAVRESCFAAGAGAVALIPEPLAAAMGAGINVYAPLSCLVLDIGEGVTDAAIIANGRIVYAWAERVACADLHKGVQRILRERYDLDISPTEAQRITETVGVAEETYLTDGFPLLRFVTASGTRPLTGIVSEEVVPFGILHEQLRPLTKRIAGVAVMLLATITSKEREEIRRQGLYLTGGGALLPGIVRYLNEAAGFTVRAVSDPLHAVVGGAKQILPIAAKNRLWERGDFQRGLSR